MNDQPPGTVTGASAGVGRATALAFVRRGWNVALIARGREGLQGTQEDIEQASGKALTVSTDVADADCGFKAADRTIEQWGWDQCLDQ